MGHNDALPRLFADSSGNEDEASVDGEELAGEFYQDLKRRASSAKNDQSTGMPSDDKRVPMSQLPSREVSPEIVSNRKDSRTSDIDKNVQPTRRFTGASPLFSGERSPASSNLQREREREFNLAGNFERTLGIQAAILLASILFVLSVGLSGGITDGSDRNFGGADDLGDTIIERFRTDDAAEAEAQTRVI